MGELFGVCEAKAGIEFHPYILKQYNDRWYLIGAAAEDGKILTFALDRIIEIQPSDIQHFEDAPEDLKERFDDIIGVTLFDNCPLQTITFWVSDESKNYILTKPLHGSQKTISGDKETILRRKYPQLAGGMFFSIECKRNYELISVLTSFGDNLLVLSPDDIRNEIINRISRISKMYHLINPSVL
ncbi:MAG: WYL domain-containing protein [Bacteroidales bacterium]|nr:WYL domain-containing protein [Bacteroidales bacterium]